MSNFILPLLVSLMKYIVPNSLSNNEQFNIAYDNLIKTVLLLLVLSILLTSTIVICCAGIGLYLIEMGYSNYEAIGIIGSIMLVFIVCCLLTLRRNINTIKNISSISSNQKNDAGGYHLISSFIDGFKAKP